MTAYGVPNAGTGRVERKPTHSKNHFLLVYNIYVSKIRGLLFSYQKHRTR